MQIHKLITVFFFLTVTVFSQNFNVNIENLKEGDSVTVIAIQNADKFFKKWVKSSDSPNAASFNLSNGDWAIKIDATGYTYPSQKVITIPNDISATFALTEMMGGNYSYNWIDDDSAAGHSTQSYIAEPTKIIVLNDTISVPTDFSSIKLRTEYGIVLSDDKEKWTNEDAYRLYKMFSNLPYGKFGEGSTVDYQTGENIRGVFYLSGDEIFEDISIEDKDGLPHATVSQSAFTYANPQIVKLDGIRGKFFSKRLYHAVVNFITDFANNEGVLNWLAEERFGIQFVKPNQFAQVFKEENGTYMGDDNSNFQDFYKTEKLEILAMFEELPEGFHKQEGLKYLVRRIDGQDHPDPNYKQAAAIAWTGLKTIEFMSKAFIGGNLSDIRRLILHEKAHFLWAYTFDDTTKEDWIEIGGWFQDAASGGWTTYNTTEFVSAYAHAKNPNEDMAESIAIYLTNPDRLINVSQKKHEFIRDRIMHGTRYVSIIREDLTFTVYNLYPDYTFPGKIVELDLKVEGESTEDKKVTMKIRLASEDPEIDGATNAYVRFASSIGTIFDLGLDPVNGSIDSVLVGSTTLSKFAKSGYWTLASLRTWDQVGNQRYENTTTVGAKLFIESPKEDITPPKFLDYNLSVIDSTFNANGEIDANGEPGQALKIVSKWEEINTPLRYEGDISRIDFPNPDQAETYYKEAHSRTINPQDTIKTNIGYMYIPDYYPSGYYATTTSYTGDPAGNQSGVNFSNDPDNAGFANNFNSFAALKDSVYVETKYPDIVKPEIDLNNITVVAEPTNPSAPNGETRVDINFNARDLSDFPGHEAGVHIVNLTLRDPKGLNFGYQTGNATMNHPDLDLGDTEPVLDSEWRNYRFNLVLPQGSAAGVWGISDIVIIDKVGNTKSYNFEEYVRFDIIESDIELEEPLEIEITDKVINAGNVDAIKAKISCKPCAGLNYVATIYSRFGGGTIVRSEGTLNADEQIVENLNTTGILDGEVNLTVQLTDAEDRLIATKTTAYTKDVVYPKAYYSRTNLENDGTSSLDDFLIAVVVETQDIGGTYKLKINSEYFAKNNAKARNTSLSIQGELNDEVNNIESIPIIDLIDGYYKFTLTVTDLNGNEGGSEILYYKKENNTIKLIGSILVDTTAPEIILTGDATVTIEVGSTYTDAGATATDNYDGDITSAIVVDNPVDISTVGEYSITYDVSDAYGNDAVQTRTVIVADTTAPEITLTGDATVSIEVGSTYTDAGATATDNYDGDITDAIVVDNPVDVSTVGEYTITFNVSDANGNNAVQTRTVIVADTTVPIISIVGDASITIEVGSAYTDAGATATDNYDEDITSSIVTVNPVDTDVVGEYTVSYNVSDANSNAAVEVRRTINVESNLSVDENMKSILRVYPNPTKNSWNIISASIIIQSIELYDIVGRKVLSVNPKSQDYEINGTLLSEGVYILFLNGKKVSRLIKN